MKDPVTRAREEKERLLELAGFKKENGEVPELDAEGNPIVVPETPMETPAPPVEEPKPDDELTQKYEALLAKYNSEIPRLHSWVKEKDEKIAALTQEITDLKAQIAILQATPSKQEVDDDGKPLYRSPHVTDEIRKSDTYQYYLGEFGQTYAERQAEMSVLAAKNTVKPVEEQVTKVQTDNEADAAFERFKADLAGPCPEWQTINHDPEFIAWLQNPAPGTGTIYHELLKDAFYSFDLNRTAQIFNLFKSTTNPPAPPKPKIPEHLAAPPRAGGGAHTLIENSQGNVLKMTDMEQLYRDFQAGKYNGREAEYEVKKREFMKAKAEGRLV